MTAHRRDGTSRACRPGRQSCRGRGAAVGRRMSPQHPAHPVLAADPVMASLMLRHGPIRLAARTPYEALVRAVVGQQLSAKAAETIFTRLTGGCAPAATRIVAASAEELRSVGLSAPKARYLRAISHAEIAGHLKNLGELTDEQVVARLCDLPGVGRWTAEMVMIFALGRDDVWPVDDAGLLRAAKALYGVSVSDDLPALGMSFRPWRSRG